MVLKYFGKLIARAAEGSVLLTDRLTILIVPFTTLLVWAFGAKMTTSLQETLLIGIAITVVAVVIFRLVAASYFLWKDDQTAKAELQKQLDQPERDAEIAMMDFALEVRKELSRKLARLAALTSPETRQMFDDGVMESEFAELILSIDSLINQLSYDFPVRIAALQLKDFCISIIAGEATREKFWEQRKLTFSLLHKADHIADFMSLIELEILIEDRGGKVTPRADSEDDPVADLKDLVRKLGPNYHKPEIRESLKKTIRDSRSDRLKKPQED